jgi:hypothetical protein
LGEPLGFSFLAARFLNFFTEGFRGMGTPACSTCRGNGLNPFTQNSSLCPMCDGTGKQFDPGRKFTYEMGPFSLNAPAQVNAQFPQYFVGAASTGPTLNGVTCQITGSPFRWMFGLKVSTFPFAIQVKDAGSGNGRSFVPQQLQVHADNLFGTAQNPAILPTPYVFDRNVQITADFTDLGGGVGVCSVTNGSPNVAWVSGALFNTGALPYNVNNGGGGRAPMWNGARITIAGVEYVISNALGSGVTSQTTLVLATNYLGATSAVAAYSVANTIRVAFDGVELSA